MHFSDTSEVFEGLQVMIIVIINVTVIITIVSLFGGD